MGTENFSRTELLLGKQNMDKLKNSKIAIFGIGGVGSYVCEGLARVGIGKFILIDNDIIEITNINRQIHATQNTVGKKKVEVEKERILSINPNAKIETFYEKYLPNSTQIPITTDIDYIIDAIDTVESKLALIEEAKKLNIPIISCMGTANKLDPTKLEIDDIKNTSVCPLAKKMRKELKNRNISKVKVLYSKEEPVKNEDIEKSKINGTVSFVPSVAGLVIASEVVKDICLNK